MGFDTQRVVVAQGDGVVARFPGILCVAQGSDPDAVRRLLALCAAVAGPDPGRALARRLVAWMSGPESPGDGLRFGTVAAAGAQLAVFLVGEVQAWVDGPGRTVLSGADAAIGTDRLLPRPDRPVIVSIGDIRLPPDPADVHGLSEGVVAGAGGVLHPARPGDILGVLDDDIRGWDARVAVVEERRQDWFADAGPQPEIADLELPPEENGRTAGAWETGTWPVHRNGLPARRNGEGGARTPWPVDNGSRAVPGGPGEVSAGLFPGRPGPVTAAGRHAINDPLLLQAGPSEANGHAPPDPAASADPVVEPSPPPPPRFDEGGFHDGGVHEDDVGTSAAEAGAGSDTASNVGDPSAGSATATGPDPASGGQTPGPGDPPQTPNPPQAPVPLQALHPTQALSLTPALTGSEILNGVTPTPVPAEPRPEQESGDASPQVRGYVCEKGHLNDPRAPFCGRCGAAMDDRGGGLVDGPRPTLGRLVFDDGAIYTVDEGYLVGRMPESDDRVQAGGLRPIVVEDRSGSVSRVHAEILVTGWDVMLLDAGSRNGTFVAGPEESGWSALAPQRGRRLLPGTRVRLGSRTFVFESASGVR